MILPGLPWHCFKKTFLTPLLETVDKVLYLDENSIIRSREDMAKVKVQMDLSKPRPSHVWIGIEDEDLTIRNCKPLEYENLPPYYEYFRHQGHDIEECESKRRDDD